MIDASVFIDLERRARPLDLLTLRADGEQLAVATITISELLVGAERADSPTRRRRRLRFIESVLTDVPVLPFDLAAAREHAPSGRTCSARVR